MYYLWEKQKNEMGEEKKDKGEWKTSCVCVPACVWGWRGGRRRATLTEPLRRVQSMSQVPLLHSSTHKHTQTHPHSYTCTPALSFLHLGHTYAQKHKCTVMYMLQFITTTHTQTFTLQLWSSHKVKQDMYICPSWSSRTEYIAINGLFLHVTL